MEKRIKLASGPLLLIVLIWLIFRNWFSFQEISAGDAPFYFQESLKLFSLFPQLWNTRGLGQPDFLIYPFFYLIFPLTILSKINLPWILIERIIWYLPFIIISIASSIILFLIIFPKPKFLFLAPLIYVFNTYILLIVGGGQISVALAYAMFTLVIALFLKNQNLSGAGRSLPWNILSGLILALEVAFEPRIAMLALAVVIFYLVFRYGFKAISYFPIFIIPIMITAGIHFYWLLPTILVRKAAYAPGLSSPDWISFLSFADFSNALSLLHPNWPENIFGKTYFMRPEFLILPILAYMSLLFIKNQKDKNILFFGSLGLLGAFLAKGSNPPLGGINELLYIVIPGMNMFRDPTKFYVLIALSYSLLIPFSLEQIYEWLKLQTKFSIFNPPAGGQNIFLIFAIGYLLFLIKPAIFGELGGTFKQRSVPREYVEFKNILLKDNSFYRTFWLPKRQRFGFYSDIHPAINGQEFFSTTDLAILSQKLKEADPTKLVRLGIKYVVIPYDSEKELFLKDRTYDPATRLKLERELDTIGWLKKKNLVNSANLTIYEISEPKNHFWLESPENQPSPTARLSFKMVSPTQYQLAIKGLKSSDQIIFSELFDSQWVAKINSQRFSSQKTFGQLNSFSLHKSGDYKVTIEYEPQKYIGVGLLVSGATLLVSLLFLVIYLIINKQE